MLVPRVPSPSSPGKGLYNPKAFVTHAASLDQAFAHCPRFPTAASRRSLGRVSVPVWPAVLSDRLPITGLVGRYPANYLIGRGPVPRRPEGLCPAGIIRYQPQFPTVVPNPGVGSHALLTRPPLPRANPRPLDLHVLSAPPAFVLSQDQTLSFTLANPPKRPRNQNPPARPAYQAHPTARTRPHPTPKRQGAARTAGCPNGRPPPRPPPAHPYPSRYDCPKSLSRRRATRSAGPALTAATTAHIATPRAPCKTSPVAASSPVAHSLVTDARPAQLRPQPRGPARSRRRDPRARRSPARCPRP